MIVRPDITLLDTSGPIKTTAGSSAKSSQSENEPIINLGKYQNSILYSIQVFNAPTHLSFIFQTQVKASRGGVNNIGV